MKYLLVILSIIVVFRAFAQPPGESASNYTLVFEDEFDILLNNQINVDPQDPYYPPSTIINTNIDITKWQSLPNYGQKGYALIDVNDDDILDTIRDQYAFRRRFFENAEVDASGTGVLKLISKKEDCWGVIKNGETGWANVLRHFNYTSQMLYSKQAFKYGYFEIKFRIPQPTDGRKIKGIGPNFWLYGKNEDCDISWSELDIFEIDGSHITEVNFTYETIDFNNANTILYFATNGYMGSIEYVMHTEAAPANYLNFITNNVHFENCNSKCTTCSNSTHYSSSHDRLEEGIFSDGQFHTIGAKWLPNSITFYIDGVATNSLNVNIINPSRLVPMHIYVDINFPSDNFGQLIDEDNVELPHTYEVDYVKVWSLNDNCNNPDLFSCLDFPNNSNNGSWEFGGNQEETNVLDDYDNDDVYNRIVLGDCDPITVEAGMDIV